LAVKVLSPSFAQHADRVRRFEQEARAVGARGLAAHEKGWCIAI
jgi:hypothetical protein